VKTYLVTFTAEIKADSPEQAYDIGARWNTWDPESEMGSDGLVDDHPIVKSVCEITDTEEETDK
jgi:hypothetical protein